MTKDILLYAGALCALVGLGLSLWDLIENRRTRQDQEDAGGAARRGRGH